MNGIVRILSRSRLRAAVETDDGFTVFDLDDVMVDLGHTVSGCLNQHGAVDLSNLSTTHTFSAYVEAIQATRANAECLCRSR
jgi:hypothetical protein